MTPEAYAALHHQMVLQRKQRQAKGVGLRSGDLIQAHVGGDIREVVEHESAGMYFRRKAEERALAARENKGEK